MYDDEFMYVCIFCILYEEIYEFIQPLIKAKRQDTDVNNWRRPNMNESRTMTGDGQINDVLNLQVWQRNNDIWFKPFKMAKTSSDVKHFSSSYKTVTLTLRDAALNTTL